jgi:hypothetical protein
MRKRTTKRLTLLTDLAQRLEQKLGSGWPPEAAEAIESLRRQYAVAIARDVTWSEMCDQITQAFACLVAGWELLPREMRQRHVSSWLVEQAHPLWRDVLAAAAFDGQESLFPYVWNVPGISDLESLIIIRRQIRAWMDDEAGRDNVLAHLFERFLAEYKSTDRKRWGVFFTPLSIVRSMLEEVDRR